MPSTIPQALVAAVRQDPTTPLLTWYDDTTGDRTELSGATLDNWVSKTANLLVDGAGLGPGDTVAVLLPPHWQTAAALLGTWAAGVAALRGPAPEPVNALFATPDQAETAAAWPADDRYVTGLLPFAMPLRDVPPGFVDYPTEVRNYGDHFRAVHPVDPADTALDGLDHAEVIGRATERAAALGITAGARVLIDTRTHPDVLDWLLAPLVTGASIVLCGNLDPAKVESRAAAERADTLVV